MIVDISHRSRDFAHLLHDWLSRNKTAGEVWVCQFQKSNADIDPGILEVTLALSALFAVIVLQPIELIIQVIAAICFLASYFTAMILYGTYVLHRTPNTRNEYIKYSLQNRRSNRDLWDWLVMYYPMLFFRILSRDREMTWDQKNTEFGYLTLLAALTVGGGTIGVYLWLSIFK